MKLDLGDYKIESDDRQFIVLAKSIVKESKLTKEENVGKEVFKPVAYHSNFQSVLKFLSNKVLLDNDDINTIKDKLEQLHKEIARLNKALEI